MQTFLPYVDFECTASVLDYRRLGKQRVEARQIYLCLTRGGGWRHHPVVKMWRGYEASLATYYNIVVREWICRGYVNNMVLLKDTSRIIPEWLNRRLCLSHRSNLLRKDFSWYSQFDWNVSDDLPYYWPVR